MSDTHSPDAGDTVNEAVEAIEEWISQTRTVLFESSVSVENYDPARHGLLTHFDGLDNHEEIERYWLNPPFSFASINRNRNDDNLLYHVVEPSLSSFESELLDRLFEEIRNPIIYRESAEKDSQMILREELGQKMEEYGAQIDIETFYRLYYYLYRSFQGYGHIDPLLNDPYVEDISCDGADIPLFAYHDEYTDIETSIVFEEEELHNFIIQLAQRSGRHISVSDPVVSTTLPDGSRVEMALGKEVTPHGSAFTIRQYADEPFTPIDLLDYGTYSLEMLGYLWLAIESNKSLIFAGGTAAGKTTSMNALAMFIPPRSKVLTIEDTRELSLYHDNWLSSVTRERLDGSDITMYDLLRSALRHRPEYIIVGEVRGEEAITLFQAMNTGHTTFSTMHADSVQTAINRLENEPINVPRPMVQSLDILCVQVLGTSDDERVRRAKALAEIEGIDQRTGELDYSTTYEWENAADEFKEQSSELIDEIRQDRGWSDTQLLEEINDRKRFLTYLKQEGIRDYRRFTAMVNKYYADKEQVMERVEQNISEDEMMDEEDET